MDLLLEQANGFALHHSWKQKSQQDLSPNAAAALPENPLTFQTATLPVHVRKDSRGYRPKLLLHCFSLLHDDYKLWLGHLVNTCLNSHKNMNTQFKAFHSVP